MPEDVCTEDLSCTEAKSERSGMNFRQFSNTEILLHSHTNTVTLQIPPELTGTEQEETRNSDAITLGLFFFLLRHHTKLSTHFI